jgi:hypothetical protein
MADQVSQPRVVPTSLDGVASIHSEIWRLEQLADALGDRAQAAAARRIARQLRASLCEVGIEIVDYAGRVYDPGMAPEVLDVRFVKSAESRADLVSETIEPTLIWHGQVLRRGQIVVQRWISLATSEDTPNGHD